MEGRSGLVAHDLRIVLPALFRVIQSLASILNRLSPLTKDPGSCGIECMMYGGTLLMSPHVVATSATLHLNFWPEAYEQFLILCKQQLPSISRVYMFVQSLAFMLAPFWYTDLPSPSICHVIKFDGRCP
jgi:hypothetical protein